MTEHVAYQAFNNKANRALMFVDFVKNQENIDTMQLLQKRRIVQQKINENCYRPKTHQELLDKYSGMHDCELYVKKIEEECKARNRVQKDRFRLSFSLGSVGRKTIDSATLG